MLRFKSIFALFMAASLLLCGAAFAQDVKAAKEKIHALYIPLADHYPAIVAHHQYASQMKHADYSVEMMKSWPALSGKFLSGQADIAFIIAPLAMNMFAKTPNFKWVSLVHRDGSALAVNDIFVKNLGLATNRADRTPTPAFANAAASWASNMSRPSISGVPSLQSTHTVVLYKYLKDHGKTLAIGSGDGDVLAKAVAPPKSAVFIQNLGKNGIAASFEQSLPWADIVEADGYGKVVWYSKDVIKWPKGHVECIIIASDKAIKTKFLALQEVIKSVHQAGVDIQDAMSTGGEPLDQIAKTINGHYVKLHSVKAIKASLNKELGVINYVNLNNDVAGLQMIMNLAVESGVMKAPIDLKQFADERFATELTVGAVKPVVNE